MKPPPNPYALLPASFDVSSDALASRLASAACGAAFILQGREFADTAAMTEEIARDLVDLAAALAARLRDASGKPGRVASNSPKPCLTPKTARIARWRFFLSGWPLGIRPPPFGARTRVKPPLSGYARSVRYWRFWPGPGFSLFSPDSGNALESGLTRAFWATPAIPKAV